MRFPRRINKTKPSNQYFMAKQFDLRVNNGGKRIGAGRPKKAKPMYLLEKTGCTNFNELINSLIDKHISNFNTF